MMPNNESSVSAVLSHSICRSEEPNVLVSSFEKKDNSSFYKRRWSIGRTHLTETNKNSYLERRMTLPLLKPKKNNLMKCELTTPVQNEGNECNKSEDHIWLNILFKFWKSEDDLSILIEKMDVSSFPEIVKVCDMVNTKSLMQDMSATDLSELVQTIYRIADLKVRRKVFENEMTLENARRTLVKFEDKLMRGIHDTVFEKVIAEESESDHKLSSMIEDLSWVTPAHLLAKIDDSNKETSQIFDKAMLDIAILNFKESPTAKLQCIMSCSRRIYEILKTWPDSSEMADDFLSILVFVVLQSNPARLHSNIRYILQFGNCEQIMRDEEGYYFTNLCSVVSFIENLSAHSLDLTEEEFHRLSSMNSGEVDHDTFSLRTRRLSCSRQLSLCICKIYHRAADGPPLVLHRDNLWDCSIVLHDQVFVMNST